MYFPNISKKRDDICLLSNMFKASLFEEDISYTRASQGALNNALKEKE